jgi:hypothetical protein
LLPRAEYPDILTLYRDIRRVLSGASPYRIDADEPPSDGFWLMIEPRDLTSGVVGFHAQDVGAYFYIIIRDNQIVGVTSTAKSNLRPAHLGARG